MWTHDDGIEVTSTFQGFTTPIRDLYAAIASRGWEVTKVKWGTDGWEAEAKNPTTGAKVKKVAPTEDAAVAHLLMGLTRLDYIRTRWSQYKLGMWQTNFMDKLAEIAEAYAKAPAYEPKAVGAWIELAHDSQRRYDVLKGEMQIEVVDEPDPYGTLEEMAEDVHKNKHLTISRANAEHPVWSVDQVVAFRAVHAVLGHVAAGGDFGWHGENRACAAHFPLLSPTAQQALFTESLARAAYMTVYQGHGPHKIALLEDHIEEAQAKENAGGHQGVHPSQSLPSTEVPRTASNGDAQEQTPTGFTPRQEGKPWKGLTLNDGRVYTWAIDAPSGPHARPHHLDGIEALGLNQNEIESGGEYLGSPSYEPIASPETSYGHGQNLVDILNRQGGAHKNAGSLDPNHGWESGVEPLLGANGQPWVSVENDPLGIHRPSAEGISAMDQASNLARIDPSEPDKRWWDLQHPDGSPNRMAMRQAVVNAFASTLLAPQKDARWHAVHYQDLADLAHTTEDPTDLHKRLEQRRIEWNRSRKISPLAHRPYYREQQDFAQFLKSANPGMNDRDAHVTAERETHRILEAEKKRLSDELAEAEKTKAPEKRTTLSQIEIDAGQEVARILKAIMDPKVNPVTDFSQRHAPFMAAIEGDPAVVQEFDGTAEPVAMGAYSPWMHDHLKSLAQVSRHGDSLLDAALRDIKDYDGAGHHFRSHALALGLRGVGPQVASHAWSTLTPERSQLATIDPHMLEVLGRKADEHPSPRDYFRLERELRARMDGAGYQDVPLGVLGKAMWDYKVHGRDAHSDHAPHRPLNHVGHDYIDWPARIPQGATAKIGDPWWRETEGLGQQIGDHFDHTIGTHFRADEVPFQDDRRYIPVTAATKTADELHVAWPVPANIRTKIANWVSTLEWPEGAELEDPANYHITAVYAEGGWNDKATHALIKGNTTTDVPFTTTGLDLFGPDKDTVVIRLRSSGATKWANRLMEEAEKLGLDVSRYPGGYRPHITIGFASALPKGDDPPVHEFRGGKLYVSKPRELVKDEGEEHHIFAGLDLPAPAVTHPDGDTDVGAPGETIMQYLRGQHGLTTEQAWEFAGDVRKK